jgi:ABC-type branched-subunit amino acid transport system ATPase component
VSAALAEPARETAAALVATGVRKAFGGVVAVNNASITVSESRISGLIGPNGAGKSTLLSILSGFLRPDAGTVRLGSFDVARRGPAAAAQHGLIRTFQAAAPVRSLSVRDNVLLGMHLRFTGGPVAALLRTPGMRAQEREARREADALLEDIGLVELQDVDAGRLTFGQLRFLEIARALAVRPRLLLLDEPTAGLNKVESDRLAALITSICARGVGLLVVDHNVPFLFELCDRITVMNYGSIIAEGSPAEIESDPAVREAYLGTERIVEVAHAE